MRWQAPLNEVENRCFFVPVISGFFSVPHQGRKLRTVLPHMFLHPKWLWSLSQLSHPLQGQRGTALWGLSKGHPRKWLGSSVFGTSLLSSEHEDLGACLSSLLLISSQTIPKAFGLISSTTPMCQHSWQRPSITHDKSINNMVAELGIMWVGRWAHNRSRQMI